MSLFLLPGPGLQPLEQFNQQIDAKHVISMDDYAAGFQYFLEKQPIEQIVWDIWVLIARGRAEVELYR